MGFEERAFKALAQLAAEGLDLRIVKTFEDGNGAPHIALTGPVAPVLTEDGVVELLVSITDGRGLATAIVPAQ